MPAVLRRMQVDPAALARVLDQDLSKRPKAYGGSDATLGSRMRALFESAEKEAAQLKDEYLSTEHFLLAIAGEGGRTPGVVALQAVGATRDTVLETLVAVRGTQRVTDQSPEAVTKRSKSTARSHRAARDGKGTGHRSRRRNPAGDPGIHAAQEQPGTDWRARRAADGHVEGLAQRIVRGDMPEGEEQAIVALDMGSPRRGKSVASEDGQAGAQNRQRAGRDRAFTTNAHGRGAGPAGIADAPTCSSRGSRAGSCIDRRETLDEYARLEKTRRGARPAVLVGERRGGHDHILRGLREKYDAPQRRSGRGLWRAP